MFGIDSARGFGHVLLHTIVIGQGGQIAQMAVCAFEVGVWTKRGELAACMTDVSLNLVRLPVV